MIQSFGDRKTERFYRGRTPKEFRGFQKQATRRMTLLENAETLGDLAALPSNRLERLSGNRAGQHSIRINRQWRICFMWMDNGPHEVQIVDYH